jgi:hypothetical protein
MEMESSSVEPVTWGKNQSRIYEQEFKQWGETSTRNIVQIEHEQAMDTSSSFEDKAPATDDGN